MRLRLTIFVQKLSLKTFYLEIAMLSPSVSFARHARSRLGFTLIELLVVISIIALLIGILLPALGAAKEMAKGSVSLNNLRQIGIATQMYLGEFNGVFFAHESTYSLAENRFYPKQSGLPNSVTAHWEDHIVKYCSVPDAFLSPLLSQEEIDSGGFWNWFAIPPFNETGAMPRKRGGYGYNNHYLGFQAGPHGFNARMGTDVSAPSRTVLVGDTAGTRKGNMSNPPSNSYVVEPPLPSVNYGAKLNAYYKGPGPETPSPGPYDWATRAYPAPRNNGQPGILFTDGHAKTVDIQTIDDLNSDGTRDNGYWNGKGDVNLQ